MKTVLVVDDSDIVLEVVRKNLEGAGYNVITRNKPSGSVAAILRDKPDVVLLDVNMPTLSGDTIAKILARVSQNPETLVLLHSSLSIDSLRLKALATGAHGYIQKTDSATELVRRIEYWLNKARAASSHRLEAVSEGTGASGSEGSASSGRFAAAPAVGHGAPSGGEASSASRLEAAPYVSSGGDVPAASSGRWRAAAPVSAQPTSASGIGAARPVAPASPSPGARASASSGAFRAASPQPSATGGTPTSRNMRAAKAIGLGADRPKVLFVDDDWKMLSSYRTIVAGYLDADFVSSSDDAFNRILSDSPPQVVVCDVVMPGLSGADIYRRAVLMDARWANRFVFITGAASTPAVAEFLNTLDVRVFHKPVPPDRLLDTLKQMTEGQRR